MAGAAGVQDDKDAEEASGVEWAGEGVLSRIVNGLIKSPLYPVMKRGARDTLINSAEKNGVAWRQQTREWAAGPNMAKAEKAFEELNDPTIVYPDYYTKPFHAYSEGNLGWLPAFECEPATMSMGLRVWKDEVKAGTLKSGAAQQRLREGYLNAVKDYSDSHKMEIHDILDVGCSVGVSTEYIAEKWPQSRITGLDLSPYFLAVAKCRQEEAGWGAGRMNWVHGNAEALPMGDSSVDFVSLCFVFHELPQAPTRTIMAEVFRVLRPGGIVAFTDNDPESPVIQGLPPVLFTLMKSTEPHSDEYYTMDHRGAFEEVGFIDVTKRESDPRHRVVLARKPQ
jgi:SAM-dependent methyltransferase